MSKRRTQKGKRSLQNRKGRNGKSTRTRRRKSKAIDPDMKSGGAVWKKDVSHLAPHDVGEGETVFKFRDGVAFLPEGYSPDELQEQLNDPLSKIRCTIDDLSITRSMGIDDPALANWTYALAALANVQERVDELEFPAQNLVAIQRMARSLGAARVIDIPGNVYGEIFHNVDVYTCEEIGGDKWSHPNNPIPRDGVDRDEWDIRNLEITKTIMEAHSELAYPDRLPFEATYFAFSSPAPVLAHNSASYMYRMAKLDATDQRMGHDADDRPAVMRVLGYLVCANGIAAEFIELTRNNDDTPEAGTLNAVVPFEVHWPHESNSGPRLGVDGPVDELGGWSNLFLLNGWVIRALVDLVNNYRSISVTEHDLGYLAKRNARKEMRKRGVAAIPRPFYRMRLQTKVTHKSWQETTKQLDDERAEPRSQTYRHDVRGHERVNVERGSKPIDPELRDKLAARGFRIYFDAVDAGDLIRMSARGVRAKEPDQWIAIRNTFIKAHISPRDESLPYVPSIHEVPPSKPGDGTMCG